MHHHPFYFILWITCASLHPTYSTVAGICFCFLFFVFVWYFTLRLPFLPYFCFLFIECEQSELLILLRAKRASNLQGAPFFLGCIKNKFPLGYLKMKLIGQWLQSAMFLFGRNLWGSPIDQWLQALSINSIKHIRRWGADGAITSRHVRNQRPYSFTYKTTRSEA